MAALAPVVEDPEAVSEASCLLTFLAGGFGNSRVNADIKSIARGIGKQTGAYSVCCDTASNKISDTIDGFLKHIHKSMDFVAEKI